ncbi:MAG: hypothetical protein KDK04_09805 [Candidatus Competibacteraceae bacterium]|nr:hypothetical protein [Candidatus Competibacteraceae bacterium]
MDMQGNRINAEMLVLALTGPFQPRLAVLDSVLQLFNFIGSQCSSLCFVQ